MILDAIAVILIVLGVINISSTAVLVWAALRHHWPALEERATVAVILCVAGTAGALLGLARLKVMGFSSEAGIVLLVVALVGISLPSIIWLIGYFAGRFDEGKAEW